MASRIDVLRELAQANEKKIILLVLDGVGGIHTADSPETALEKAVTPNFDALARRSALGRSLPSGEGITPGSGPGHLSLFGYDPLAEEHQIGRGALEAVGIQYNLKPTEIAARGNFCSLDAQGNITDRRAGRPSTQECMRLATKLNQAIKSIGDVKVTVRPVREHRFCVMFDGPALEPGMKDTDPQRTGVPPLPAAAEADTPAMLRTCEVVLSFISEAEKVLKGEQQANGLTLRGFSKRPDLSSFQDLYKLNPAAVAAYPLYRGVARLAGMKLYDTGALPAEEFETVAKLWGEHDFFFIHIKKTDSHGEDGNLEAKTAEIEAVDAALPILLDLKPDVLAVTGDHSTPYVMKAHSWHPVPLLVAGPLCDIDPANRYTEAECLRGSIGTIPGDSLMGLMMANAGKLAKYGA